MDAEYGIIVVVLKDKNMPDSKCLEMCVDKDTCDKEM